MEKKGARTKRRWCAVLGCSNFQSTPACPEDIKLTKFPADLARSYEWCVACGNDDLLKIQSSTLHNNRFVCKDHFRETDFDYRGILFRHVKPSQNLPTPLTAAQIKVWPVLDNVLKWRKPLHKSLPPLVELESDIDVLKSLENNDEDNNLSTVEEVEQQSVHISRPMEHHGAQKRAKGRYTRSKLLMDCGVNPELSKQIPVQNIATKAQEYRAQSLKLKQKLERALRRNGSLKHLAKQNSVDAINELLISDAARHILDFELRNFSKKPQGRRWTLKDKNWCLAIYRRNVSVYRFLCTILTLPSVDVLWRLTKELIIEPGFNIPIFKCLEQKILNKKWNKKDKTCAIMFDEMSLQKGIYVNSAKGYLDGFENYGHLGRTSAIATHSLNFVLRGLHSNWKIPIGYFLTKNTVPTEVLAELLPDAVKMCQSIGLNVVASISDQGATNRSAIALLRNLCEKGEYEPLYEVDGVEIVHLFDTPHLLKNIRNNLMVSNVQFGKRGQFLAKWGDVIKYHSMDVLSFGKRIGLTHDHLYPTGRAKMRVKYAAQALSYSVASAMCSIVVASEGRHLSDCLHTAKFIHDVDLLFDICNGPGPKDKVKSHRCNVSEGSIHHELWRKMYASLKTWRYLKKITDKEGKISVKQNVPPCVTGWMENIKGFQRLWTTLKSLGFKEMNLRRFNSDPVENLHSVVRQTNGSNRNPTCIQFESSMKTALVNGMSHFKIKAKNCVDDDSVLLSTEEALFGSDAGTEASNLYIPNNKTILVRGQPEYFKPLVKDFDKCSRLGPSVQCNSIASKVLKEKEFENCLSCKRALLATDPSSDHILSSNLNNNLDCFENDDNFNYAEVLKSTTENLKNQDYCYSSPALVQKFITCHTRFMSDCASFLYLNNCLELTKELICITCKDFDWLNCSEHQGSLKLKLVSCMAECFLNQLCRSINKYWRDSMKRKNLLSKLKAQKVAVAVAADPVDDPDWMDISEEEAATLTNFVLGKNNTVQTGVATKKRTASRPAVPAVLHKMPKLVVGTPLSSRNRTAPSTPQLHTPQRTQATVVSTMYTPTQSSTPATLAAIHPSLLTPARAQATVESTFYTPTPGRLKVLSSWASTSACPATPAATSTPSKHLTNAYLKTFLAEKGVKGISRCRKEELLALYNQYN